MAHWLNVIIVAAASLRRSSAIWRFNNQDKCIFVDTEDPISSRVMHIPLATQIWGKPFMNSRRYEGLVRNKFYLLINSKQIVPQIYIRIYINPLRIDVTRRQETVPRYTKLDKYAARLRISPLEMPHYRQIKRYNSFKSRWYHHLDLCRIERSFPRYHEWMREREREKRNRFDGWDGVNAARMILSSSPLRPYARRAHDEKKKRR